MEIGGSLGFKPSSNLEYVRFQRNILRKLGYFGITTSRIFKNSFSDFPSNNGNSNGESYFIVGNTLVGYFMYWILHINVTVKAIFLLFLVSDYFGPIEFLDKVASLDYILCSGLVVIGFCVFAKRYPFYEIVEGIWVLLNSIYAKHGCPIKIRWEMEQRYKRIIITHLIIIFGGCTALMIQYFPDPKYCNFTYSTFKVDIWFLRGIFGLHEFFFMMMAWNGYAGPSTLSMFQGVAISKIIYKMNETIQSLYRNKMRAERIFTRGQGYNWVIKRESISVREKAIGTEYDIKKLLKDYQNLMMICTIFNDSVAYKTLFLHICGGSQFVSDVFAATHVLRLPGTGFMDVWFYIWDCMSAGFMLLRVYHFMGFVSDASEMFLASVNDYMTFPNGKKKELQKVIKTLRLISLNVGPCQVSPESVLTVLDTMGNYYVCAALW